MRIQSISSTPNFHAAPGKFLNPKAEYKKSLLQETLKDSFDDGGNIIALMRKSITKVFPDMNFVLAPIEDLKSNVLQKLNPIIEIMTTYTEEKPLSFIFLNAKRIVNIINDEQDGIYGYKKLNKMLEDISEKVTLAEEPYFISKVASDFTQKLYIQDEITPETVNSAAEEIFVKYDLDINNKVVDKTEFDKINPLIAEKDSNIMAVAADKNDIRTIIYINPSLSDTEQFPTVVQNFTNVLAENSKMFNQLKLDLIGIDNAPRASSIDAGSVFVRLDKNFPNFLEWPIVLKKAIYDQIISNTLAPYETKEEKEIIFKQILNQISQEALSYTNMPPILDNSAEKRYLPIDKYYKDFHMYLCGVNTTDFSI